MRALINIYDFVTNYLKQANDWLWPLLLRAILFYEFFFPGLGKLNGENWFTSINHKFPFPFNRLSADINWIIAGYGEVIFASLLLVGLFTRFAAISLVIITGVAVAAVHWPESWSSLSQLWEGYTIKSSAAGNYKLPLLYALMLIPLIFNGGGKFSLDKILLKLTNRYELVQDQAHSHSHFYAPALVFSILAIAIVWVMPLTGIVLLIISTALGLTGFITNNR